MDAAEVVDENDAVLLLLLLLFGLMYGENMEWIDNADECCAPPVEVEVNSDGGALPRRLILWLL
jgi:hypothetical protein